MQDKTEDVQKNRKSVRKRDVLRFVAFVLIGVFGEYIQAAIAILLVIASLLIAVGSWHLLDDQWYWLAIPSILALATLAYLMLKFFGNPDKLLE